MQGSHHAFFHLCLASVLFSAPSLTEMKFQKNFFHQFPFFFRGFLNPPPNRRRTCLLCCRLTLLAWGMNMFCTSDERFSAGDKHIENAHSNFTYTAGYQPLSNRTYIKMIATHRYSPSKTGGSYHTLLLASEYAIPTSYIRNSILCWTK